jgi:Sec7-like guanine-nucleotide exchange factor
MSKSTKSSDAQQTFAVDSPGKEPQSLPSVLNQFAAQFRDMAMTAQLLTEGGSLVALQSEVDAIQDAINRVRGARDSLSIVLRSVAYTNQEQRDREKAIDALIDAFDRAAKETPEMLASDVIVALRKNRTGATSR